MANRKSRVISKEEVEYILSLSQKDLESFSTFMDLFGVFDGKAPRFNTYDIAIIPPNSYGPTDHKNKNEFVTTVGRLVFNMTFILQDFFDIFGYINKPLNKKTINNINKEISYAIIEDRKDINCLKRYLNRQQKFQPYSSIICSGFSEKMINMSEVINKKKEELRKKYAKELANPDEKVLAATRIEKELIDFSKEYLGDDESMDMYNSGSKVSMGNNFKNMFIMKGPINSPDPTEGFDISFSSYLDGISREDFPILAKSLAAGPYDRAKATPRGGYQEKLFLRAFQHLRLAPKGTDCHTKRTIEVYLDDDMAEMMMYSYIVDGNNLVELTSETLPKYLNKTVKFRFSSLCEYDKDGQICNACAGNLFYRLGFENVGVVTPQVASTSKLARLKSFHSSVINFHEIDVNKAFGFDTK
ncbi:MAG: hypothetical protein IJ193_00030 [Bacilli bacterium]|nr:hypothetical protein [Bacilli bacterium]